MRSCVLKEPPAFRIFWVEGVECSKLAICCIVGQETFYVGADSVFLDSYFTLFICFMVWLIFSCLILVLFLYLPVDSDWLWGASFRRFHSWRLALWDEGILFARRWCTVIVKCQETYRDKTFQAPFHSSCVLLSKNLSSKHPKYPKHPCELECVCSVCIQCISRSHRHMSHMSHIQDAVEEDRRGSKRCRGEGVHSVPCVPQAPPGLELAFDRQDAKTNFFVPNFLDSSRNISNSPVLFISFCAFEIAQFFCLVHGITGHHSLASSPCPPLFLKWRTGRHYETKHI